MQSVRKAFLSAVVASLLSAGVCAQSEQIDRRWIDRTASESERESATAMLGTAPPDFGPGVRFIGDPVSLDDLLGKVVIVQFWSRADRRTTLRLEQLAALKKRVGDDLAVIAMHTESQGEGIEVFLERRDPGLPVAVDADGGYAEALGVRSPLANLIIDRAGNARYAFLNPTGIQAAVERLVAESGPAGDAETPERPTAAPPTARLPSKQRSKPGFWEDRLPDERFPPISGEIGDANDLRGKRGPEIVVEEWITPVPDVQDKVVVVDFWATWCGPCIAAIPHMNRLGEAFPGEVVVLGVSNEPVDHVRGWMPGKGVRYAIGVDPQRRMAQEVRNRYIPHAIVYSPDGVVRWQGNPSTLTPEELGKIVDASRR